MVRYPISSMWVLGILSILLIVGGGLYGTRRIRYYKALMRDYLIEQKRYRIATELTNDVLFEYNMVNDVIEFSDKYEGLYGRKPKFEHYAKDKVALKHIYEEDRDQFIYFFQQLNKGEEFIEAEFRLLNANNEFEWCHAKGKTIFDHQGRPLRVIGKIVNIDTQKKTIDSLKNRADRDPLTNALNKSVTKDSINEVTIASRASKDKHALFVVDIDDFKSINDHYGHMQGDKVLSSVVSKINRIFRSTDIIGRIGGDEFVILMKHINTIEEIKKKAQILQDELNSNNSAETDHPQITASIGISIYPRDGGNYDELFVKADKALYDAKDNGKKNYMIYEP
ncbi:diguanylate cyclase/phosphodiesterase with PAS/PAC sensor(s) [Lachnospiraceae bacterium KM106-2]|nr:diguanylate cyclase/phosphodiesterase with PAS/PAC sensor(s) [Lachnospiraceae bacterium KM106-2]